jgi:hypothetical protein
MTRLTRRQALASLASLGAVTLAGCIEGAGGEAGDGSGATVPAADARLPLPMEPSALREAAVSGGPDKDGIPSIDDPSFIAPSEVSFLADGDPVFGVVRDGVAKAYPQKILVHHEIVNDDLAGDPVSVTYCPLTGTALGFDRGGTTFGVSGRLVNDNLIMYDRATETWWPQILATAIPGPWNADPQTRSLREFRLIWTTWGRWRDQHPETRVLSRETGHPRNYARDPYGSYNPRDGYYAGGAPLFPPLREDDRYGPKRVVMGARAPEGAVAFLKDSLREAGVLTGQLGDVPVLAVHDPRYDTGYVYRNPDEAAYEVVGGRVRGPTGENAFDRLPLDRVHTFDAMWFAWTGFYPETNVYE